MTQGAIEPVVSSSMVRGSSHIAGFSVGRVNVFEFTDYRSFLQKFHEAKKAATPHYSQSSFARKAGLGKNSRGYLKLIIEGKRNLTPHTIRAFIEAIGLDGREALYFENLVYFNQAKTARDKEYYFGRISAAAEGRETAQFEILQSQYSYCSRWYMVAVRELVGLAGFNEDPAWICAQLRNKIGRKDATEALVHLARLGMIKRDESGRYVQSEPLVKFTGGFFNPVILKFHDEMLDRAKESLREDPYEERSASGVTLSCDHAQFAEIRRMIDQFRDQVTLRFGVGSTAPNSIFQINVQFFQLTPIPDKKKGEQS